MAAGGGNIVNMSSFAAVAGVVVTRLAAAAGSHPPQAYGAAKAGIEALTRTTASVGAPVNIRCNAVRPGAIGPRAHQNFQQVFEPIQLLPGAGAFTDIANAVAFLVFDEARFITGQVLDINGGAAGKL
ncbi:MAG: SDR family oxidoreductase [Mycobacterium sp.]